LLVALLLLGRPHDASARSWRGAPLPAGCKEVEPERLRCSSRFERVVAFYRRAFRGSPTVRLWRATELPGVKLVHVANSDPGAWWEGLNISEFGGTVYLFWLVRRAPVGAPPEG